MVRPTCLLACALWAACAQAAAPGGGAEGAPRAMLADIDGPIGPATAAFFDSVQRKAEQAGAAVIVLRMDTPGGLDRSMRDIVKTILASRIPVVGYVAPGGARAASAGTYILYAAHLAAMAPATNLGAATPIPVGGSWPEPKGGAAGAKAGPAPPAGESGQAPAQAEELKAVNDAVAYIRSLAQQRGRNADWAESAVRQARSLTAAEAVQLKVVDLLADDVGDLLRKIDGRSVALPQGTVTLHTAGAAVTAVLPGWRIRWLAVLTNPTIAYALLLVGIYGLLLEGYHPGAVLPGVTGGIALLMALYAFQLLPVNYAGLLLMGLGVALLIAEISAPSFGVLGFGGIAAFVLGSVLLLDTDVPGFGVNLGVIGGIALAAAAVLALTLFLVLRARRAPVVTGANAMVGQVAEVLEPFTGEGWALLLGERWRVRCALPQHAGARVRVTAVDGLLLTVEPAEPG
ncbi:MAG: nodulation protein NfeD [Nevskia sp.]|nr:nodulation protein NfeD [Nevskia sp.]